MTATTAVMVCFVRLFYILLWLIIIIVVLTLTPILLLLDSCCSVLFAWCFIYVETSFGASLLFFSSNEIFLGGGRVCGRGLLKLVGKNLNNTIISKQFLKDFLNKMLLFMNNWFWFTFSNTTLTLQSCKYMGLDKVNITDYWNRFVQIGVTSWPVAGRSCVLICCSFLNVTFSKINILLTLM